MISKKEDYSYLLDDLRSISYNYYLNYNGDIINKNGKIEKDDRIKLCVDFYALYCMAYKKMNDIKEKSPKKNIDRETIIRALASYEIFNYLINICIAEYRLYGDIGTGIVSYIPYEPLFDFFFEDNCRKETLVKYLNNELDNVLNDENTKKRVK